jgi:hypothetical protein
MVIGCTKVACELFAIGPHSNLPQPADLWISARRTHLLDYLVLLVQKFHDIVYFRFYEDLGLVGYFPEFRVIFSMLGLSQLLGYFTSGQMYIRRANETLIIISSLQDGRKSV